MICLCQHPLRPYSFYSLELCSCPICWTIVHYSWRLLNKLPVYPDSSLQETIQEFQQFTEQLQQWINRALEAQNSTTDLLPFLPSRFITFQQKNLSYLDLLLYPTEDFARINEYFPQLRKILLWRLFALENKIAYLCRRGESDLKQFLTGVLWWGYWDYTLTLQSLWEKGTTPDYVCL